MSCACEKKTERQQVQVAIEKREITLNVLEPERNVFEIAIPINIKSEGVSLTKGKYRFYFNIENLNANQLYFLLDNFAGERNTEFKVLGKKVIYRRGYASKDLKKFIMEIELIENPIPLTAIVYVILGLVGVIGGLMLLEKVERIIEISKPLTIVLGLIALIFVLNALTKLIGR
jgi:hypothetical protein